MKDNNKYQISSIKVDGLKATPEYLSLLEKVKTGEISKNEIPRILCQKYRQKS